MAKPRRDPYPFDMVANNHGLMLGVSDPKAGAATLIATKPPDMSQTAPGEYGYDAQPPTIETVQDYSDLSGGMGLKVQRGPHDTQYYYALNADASTGQPWIKGPAVTTYTPAVITTGGTLADLAHLTLTQMATRTLTQLAAYNAALTPSRDTTNGVVDILEVGTSLYMLGGRYAWKYISDTSWELAKDFGLGNATLSGTTVYSNNSGGTLTGYVALGDSVNFWMTDGTRWDQHASLTSRAFGLAGRQLFRSPNTNLLALVDVDADPRNAANWSTANSFSVGDKSSSIQRLTTVLSGTLLILKGDGIYTLDPDGLDHNLYPSLQVATTADNGKWTTTFLKDTFISYGKSCYRITPQLVLGATKPHLPIEEIGPERMAENDSEVRGRVTAMAGHGDFCMYAGLYNDDTGASYVLKFGSFATDPKTGQPVRVEAWHGSITAAFVGKKITTMRVSSVGAVTGHQRLYLGFSDSTFAHFTLPCVPNPAACTAYSFNPADGYLRMPWFHGEFRNDTKVAQAVTVTGLNLSRTDYASVQLMTDPTLGYANLTDTNQAILNFNTAPRQKVGLAGATLTVPGGSLATLSNYTLTQLSSYTLAQLAYLGPTAVSPTATFMSLGIVLKTQSGTSPQILGMGLHYAVVLPNSLIYEFYVLADRAMVKRDGTRVRQSPDEILALVAAMAAAPAVAVILPDETRTSLRVIGFSESQAWNEQTRKWSGGMKIQAVRAATADQANSTVYGTLTRLSSYTLAQMGGYTLIQLATQ